MKPSHLLFAILSFTVMLPWAAAADLGPHPRADITTNMGEIVVALDAEKAPKTVDNFIKYARDGFYDGTIFHRVIPNFVIQGGGYTKDFREKQTRAPIDNEADNGLENARGTIAMARTGDPNSATAQFFINLSDNDFLNFRSHTVRGAGYAVFGKVVKGMDVVDKIAQLPTGAGGPFRKDVPRRTVVIKKITIEKTPGGK